MAKKEEIKKDIPILTPEEIERRHQAQFIQAYNELVKEYGYALQPVIRLELIKLPKAEEKPKKEDEKKENTKENTEE